MYQYPFQGTYRVTCPFGKKGNWQAGWHIGVDLVGEKKDVYPIAEGIVESINRKGKSYGNHVVIRHEDGMVSLYAHLKNVLVHSGEKVNLNTKLGVMGATGHAYGEHLHLELHKERYRYPQKGMTPKECGWIVNPMRWIAQSQNNNVSVQKKEKELFKQEKKTLIQNLKILKNQQEINVLAVNVEGNNFIRLRDLEKLFPVQVSFDGEKPVLQEK